MTHPRIPQLATDDIKKRLRALDHYEQSQWLIMRSDNYGGDDPDLLWREIEKVGATRAKLKAMLKDATND